MARPLLDAIVRRLASIHGISWSTWKSRQRLRALRLVDPVREPADLAAVGHHRDDRLAVGDALDVAAAGRPLRRVAAGAAVQEVEHREARGAALEVVVRAG